MNEIEFPTLIQKASKFLRQRDRTSEEVRSFFISKGYEPSLVERLIEYMKEISLLNDERFCKNFIIFQMEKGFGKYVIIEKLRKFGISDLEITESIKSIPSASWVRVCEKQISHSRKNYIQIFQTLLRRGFEREEIEQAFQNLNIPIFRDEFYESV